MNETGPSWIFNAIKAGRTLTTCAGEVHAERAGGRTLVAILQATMMTQVERQGVVD